MHLVHRDLLCILFLGLHFAHFVLRFSENSFSLAQVVLKLNGGLGTGMGLEKAKSLLPVTGGLSFLDLIAQQVKDIDLVVPKGLDFGGHPQKGSILPKICTLTPKDSCWRWYPLQDSV